MRCVECKWWDFGGTGTGCGIAIPRWAQWAVNHFSDWKDHERGLRSVDREDRHCDCFRLRVPD